MVGPPAAKAWLQELGGPQVLRYRLLLNLEFNGQSPEVHWLFQTIGRLALVIYRHTSHGMLDLGTGDFANVVMPSYFEQVRRKTGLVEAALRQKLEVFSHLGAGCIPRPLGSKLGSSTTSM